MENLKMQTTIIDPTEIDLAKVTSQLDSSIHVVLHDDKKFVCFNGYVIPQRIAVVFLLWIISGRNYYVSEFSDSIKIQNELVQLNSPRSLTWKKENIKNNKIQHYGDFLYREFSMVFYNLEKEDQTIALKRFLSSNF